MYFLPQKIQESENSNNYWSDEISEKFDICRYLIGWERVIPYVEINS